MKSRFREPPVEIWGAENILLKSSGWILYVIVSVRLCTATKNWRWPSIHSILCSMTLLSIFWISEHNKRYWLGNLCNFQDLKRWNLEFYCPARYLVYDRPRSIKITVKKSHIKKKIFTTIFNFLMRLIFPWWTWLLIKSHILLQKTHTNL